MKERRKEKRRRRMTKVISLEAFPFHLSPWAT
jgi:hypothetical protein